MRLKKFKYLIIWDRESTSQTNIHLNWHQFNRQLKSIQDATGHTQLIYNHDVFQNIFIEVILFFFISGNNFT